MPSEAVAVQPTDKMRDERPDIKVVQLDSDSAVNQEAGDRKTVRSGSVYDLDAHERRRKELKRAERLKKEIGEDPIIGIEDRRAYRFAKRVFDTIFSACVLVVIAVPSLMLAAAIRLESKGNPFYSQVRVGRMASDGSLTTFRMWKFRSMYADAEDRLEELKEQNEISGAMFKMREDPRVTRIGRFIRRHSIDEFPQFVNVLLGKIPLRILKTRPELSAKDKGAFALPAKPSTNESKAFSQVVSCFMNGLRVRRAASSNCNLADAAEVGFLAKPIIGAVCA